MSRPKVENIENLWRNIEGPPPSIPFKLEENMSNLEAEFEEGGNPFEGQVYGPPGTEPYDDPFDPNGDLGDYDAEVEIINLNKRVSREFSLSHYDVNIHEFGRLRAQHYSESEGANSEDLIQSGELTQSDEFQSGELNHTDFAPREVNYVHDYEGSNDGTGSGHLICDCEDCINQTEAVECHCENCVQTGEATPHTPPPGEVTCDCDDCLNNSTESYSCDCENCRTGDKVINNNHPDETCKCENCVGRDEGHLAYSDGEEHSGENDGEVWGSSRYRGHRGSPQGSSQQFDLPSIEEVDHLEEYDLSPSVELNNVGHGFNEADKEAVQFSKELYTKLENLSVSKGEPVNENANFSNAINRKDHFNSNIGKVKPNNLSTETVHVFNGNLNKSVHVYNTKSSGNGQTLGVKSHHGNVKVFSGHPNDGVHAFNGNLESRNKCSNCEVGHSLDEECALNILDHHQTLHCSDDGTQSCSWERCISPPPKSHTHVVQPLAVNIHG